jgi:hypothetical protein
MKYVIANTSKTKKQTLEEKKTHSPMYCCVENKYCAILGHLGFYRRHFCKKNPLVFRVTKALLHSLRAKFEAGSLNRMTVQELNIAGYWKREFSIHSLKDQLRRCLYLHMALKICRCLYLRIELKSDFEVFEELVDLHSLRGQTIFGFIQALMCSSQK